MNRKPSEPARKEENEYIPTFISQKPFYLNVDQGESDYLEHQRLQEASKDQSQWYDRGGRAGPAATKYRKGACENCGALTHKTKDCLSRPRAKGAKWTGKNIQADELIQTVELGWDAKRDRWNGYEAREYQNVVNEYEELQAMKNTMKKGSIQQSSMAVPLGDTASGDTVEEAKYAEESDMGRQQSTATRCLRLREDTAKYLVNLDLDSAKYDPKTRSMLDPGAQIDQTAALVAEQNFLRTSGDAAEFERAQQYAWESQERGDKVRTHLQANPTAGEAQMRSVEAQAHTKHGQLTQKLINKYGGEQYSQKLHSKAMAVTEAETYAEYDDTGSTISRQTKPERSRYAEDAFLHNHKSIWGSWWSEFQWGYKCCNSLVKNSYCTGTAESRVDLDRKHLACASELDNLPIVAQAQKEPATNMLQTPSMKRKIDAPAQDDIRAPDDPKKICQAL